MDSQISKDTLFGSEQFSVGGYYSVRGFRENYISGDHGYYFRNKASFNLGQFLVPTLTAKNNKGEKGNNKNKGFISKNLHHLYDFKTSLLRFFAVFLLGLQVQCWGVFCKFRKLQTSCLQKSSFT